MRLIMPAIIANPRVRAGVKKAPGGAFGVQERPAQLPLTGNVCALPGAGVAAGVADERTGLIVRVPHW